MVGSWYWPAHSNGVVAPLPETEVVVVEDGTVVVVVPVGTVVVVAPVVVVVAAVVVVVPPVPPLAANSAPTESEPVAVWEAVGLTVELTLASQHRTLASALVMV